MARMKGVRPVPQALPEGFFVADTETLTEFQDAIARELGVSWGLMDWPSDDQGPHIYLDTLDVPYGSRGRGTGTAAMQALTDYADSVGKVVILTPEPDDRDRLVKFYKRFGFVENRGANRNLDLFRSPRGRFAEMVELDNELDRDVMYRLPRQTNNPAKKPAAKKKAVKKTLYYRGTQTADSGKTARGLPSYTPCLGAALIYSAVPGDPFASTRAYQETRFLPTSTVIATTIDTKPSLILGEGLSVSMGDVLRALKYGEPDGMTDAEVRRVFNYLHNRLLGNAPGGSFIFVVLDEDGEPEDEDDWSFSIFGSRIKDMRDEWTDSEFLSHWEGAPGLLEMVDRLVADTFIFADAPAVQKVAKRLGYRSLIYLDVFAGGKDAAEELFGIDVGEIDCVDFAYDLENREQPCHETVRPLPGTEVEVEWSRPSAELVDMFREEAPVVASNPGRRIPKLPRWAYHAAPPSHRDTISRIGLLPGTEASYGPPGVYLFRHASFAENYRDEPMDVWKVDIKGLSAYPDPEDPVAAIFTEGKISPSRLTYMGTFENGQQASNPTRARRMMNPRNY